jgi:hypothetical protein
VLEPLRQGADFTVYRGRKHGNLSPVRAVAVTGEQPSPHGLRRLEHEYSLAAELDPAWAARPLALTRHEGRTILILQDPGGEPLDRAVYNLKVLIHTVKSENTQAVDSALACLHLFGIHIPSRPTWEEVQAEYETVWRNLDGRPIESLIDLPLMTDPELQAAMQVLSVLTPPAYFTDLHLFCLHLRRMVNISMQYGMSGASANAIGYWGGMLGPVFHRYREARVVAKLACDLVEKHGDVGDDDSRWHAGVGARFQIFWYRQGLRRQ